MKTTVFALLLFCCVHASFQFILSNNNEAAFLKRQLRQAPAQSDSTSVENPNHLSFESASNEINEVNKIRLKRAATVVSDESVASPEVSAETNKDPLKQSIESSETSVESQERVNTRKNA
uniref:Uncharacterized protein n=1 Tax=Panagrolaimus sp. ES5 TaxID=591445 RepID=A0AC34G4S8_9BILA